MPRIELYTLLDLVGDLSDSTEAGSASARFRKATSRKDFPMLE